jgi:hypothetical protein
MFHPSESFPLTPDLFVYSSVHQARGAVLCKIGSPICKTAISPCRDVFIALRPLDTLNYWLTLLFAVHIAFVVHFFAVHGNTAQPAA